MSRRAWYSSSLRGVSRVASTPSSPAGDPGEDQGVSWMAVAAKISSRRLGGPGGLGGALRRQERTPEKGPASPGGPRQPGARPGGRGVLVHRQRAPGKAPACPGCPWPPRARLGSWVPLGGQGPPLRRQRPPGKAPACPGRPWPPRAHLGGSSSLEGWGPGAAAPAEGPCLRRRVTPATAGCVSPAAQAAGWPLAQAARGP